MKHTPKTLGIWLMTALVTGNMIGSGIFLLPASLAGIGSLSLIAWIFTALGAMLIAWVFADLSRMMPHTGGHYVYCRAAFGNFAGFQIAYNYWIALCVGNAAIVVALTSYLSFFWPSLISNPWHAFCINLAIVWMVTFINILGIREAGIIQLITTILKILPLILIIILGIFCFHPEYLKDFNVSGKSTTSAFSTAAIFTLWSFVGLESATVPADHADRHNTIARATIYGTLITALIYLASTTIVMGVIPNAALAQSNAPYAQAATEIFRHLFGESGLWSQLGSTLIALGAIISCLGALNGWTLLQGQIPFAAARDDLFPKRFAQLSRFHTPAFGLIISSTIISLLLLLTLNKSLIQQFNTIILLATLASLIPYFFTCLSEIVMCLRHRDKFNATHLRKAFCIAMLGSTYAFWAIGAAGVDIVFYGTLLFLSSVPAYVWLLWHNHRNIHE